MELPRQSACRAYRKTWIPAPALHKIRHGVIAALKRQEFKASPDNRRLCLKRKRLMDQEDGSVGLGLCHASLLI